MKKTLLATVAALSTALSAPAFAQDTAGPLTLELNTVAELDGGACRLVYVVSNETAEDLTASTYEVAVFNGRGAVSNMLLMEFGAIDAGKTRVVQFDVAGQACSDISRILVNNQVDCATASGDSTMCMDALATRTLDTTIAFTN